jgi:hypothetical protein
VNPPRLALLAACVLAVGGVAAGALALGGPPSHPAVKVQVTQSDTAGAGSPSPSPSEVTPSLAASAGGALPTTPPRAATIAPSHLPTPPTSPVPVVQSSPATASGPKPTLTACPLNAMCVPPVPPEGPPAELQLNDSSNGTSVTIAAGGRIQISLASTYWTFDPSSNPAVLAVQGPQQVTPCPINTTVPGSGCGTATMTFVAEGAGTATLSAHRTSCGEAMLCTGDQGSFKVTVVVQ